MKKYFLNILNKSLKNFRFFYAFAGKGMFLTFFLSIIVGVLDSIGISLFLPLLEIADGSSSVDEKTLGKLSFIIDFFEKLNIPLTVLSVIALLVIIFLFKSVMVFYSFYQRALIKNKLIKKVRFRLIEGLQNISYKNFIELNMGQMNSSFTTEVGQTSSAFQYYLNSIYQLIMVFTYLLMAIMVNAQFTLIVLIIIPPIGIVFSYLNRKTKLLSFNFKDENRIFVHELLQTLVFFKYLKATNVLSIHRSTLRRYASKIEKIQFNIAKIKGIVNATKELFIIIVIAGLVLIQVNYIGGSISSIIIVLLLLYRNFGVFTQFQNSWQTYVASTGSIEGVKETLTLVDSHTEKYSHKELNEEITSIKCINLSFSYGNKQIIKNINLSISKNQSIALVGESGSGKTTIANLIAGLLLPSEGHILINGQNLSDFNLNSYRSKIGYITQEPVIFSESIYENVTLTQERSDILLQRFWDACARAHLKDFILSLEKRENSVIGDFGVTLSGGQKQRITIARELFRKPELLIMDEATSALDSETEKIIQQNMEDLFGNTTLIIIAHRLSTIKEVDCIYIVDKGNIIDYGIYKELLAKSTGFARMVEKQLI